MSKTWFITGASSGFGRSLTEKLLARGERVAVTSRNTQALDDLGRIDVIVSNAGYGVLGAAEETTDEQLRCIVDTNLIGSIVLIRSALPHLRAHGGGRILQVSSEGGQIAYPGFSLYHATKW